MTGKVNLMSQRVEDNLQRSFETYGTLRSKIDQIGIMFAKYKKQEAKVNLVYGRQTASDEKLTEILNILKSSSCKVLFNLNCSIKFTYRK